MTKAEKIFDKVIRGTSDNNLSFSDLRSLLLSLYFRERVKGSHHIYTKIGIEEIINIQPNGDKAKAYQVKQIRNIILKYKISGENI